MEGIFLLIYLTAFSTALYLGPSEIKREMKAVFTNENSHSLIFLYCYHLNTSVTLFFFKVFQNSSLLKIEKHNNYHPKKYRFLGNLVTGINKGFEQHGKKILLRFKYSTVMKDHHVEN